MSWTSFRDQSLSCSIDLPSLGQMGFDWAMHGNLTVVRLPQGVGKSLVGMHEEFLGYV